MEMLTQVGFIPNRAVFYEAYSTSGLTHDICKQSRKQK